MKIAVLGTGRVGGALGVRWSSAGHDVVFGSRDPAQPKVKTLVEQTEGRASAASLADAAVDAEVLIYAGPWTAAEQVLSNIDTAGKILVDCTNPLNETFDGLALGYSESAAEKIAEWAPQAAVVKAFNTVSSATMANPDYNGQPAALFICGDDDDAKATVKDLADSLGFDTIDAGPLRNARYLEPFAMLYIYLAMNGRGGNFAFQILNRDAK